MSLKKHFIKCDVCKKLTNRPFNEFHYFLKGRYHPDLPDKNKVFLYCSQECEYKGSHDPRLSRGGLDVVRLVMKRLRR